MFQTKSPNGAELSWNESPAANDDDDDLIRIWNRDLIKMSPNPASLCLLSIEEYRCASLSVRRVCSLQCLARTNLLKDRTFHLQRLFVHSKNVVRKCRMLEFFIWNLWNLALFLLSLDLCRKWQIDKKIGRQLDFYVGVQSLIAARTTRSARVNARSSLCFMRYSETSFHIFIVILPLFVITRQTWQNGNYILTLPT